MLQLKSGKAPLHLAEYIKMIDHLFSTVPKVLRYRK